MIFRSADPEPSIPNLSLSDFVMAQFATFGDKPAVIDGPTGRTLTYAQLAVDVRRMAVGLVRRGMNKGDVFAILLPNVPEYATALLGVASVGGVVTTINPLMTADEIRRQLNDTGAQWLLTFAPLAERAGEASRSTLVREIFSLGEAPGTQPFAALLAEDGPMPEVAIDPLEDLLVLPYSSGTGGLPEGVMLAHRNVVAQLCQADVALQGDSERRVIAVAPFFHILGLVLILLAWLGRGGMIVAFPKFDLEQFLGCVQKYRIRYASLFRRSCWRSRSIRWSTSTTCPALNGSAPVQHHWGRNRKRLRGASWLSGWAGLGHVRDLGCRRLCASIRAAADPSRLQRPAVAGQRGTYRRSHATGADLGPGQTGELLVRGPDVMKGYLNRPAENAATLLADGSMRTGDIASFDAEGFLYIVDRVKELIKYNAYQIAPAELEAVLVSHPAVAEAAVIPSPDEEHGEVPKAFVVLRSPATQEELMGFVAERVAPLRKFANWTSSMRSRSHQPESCCVEFWSSWRGIGRCGATPKVPRYCLGIAQLPLGDRPSRQKGRRFLRPRPGWTRHLPDHIAGVRSSR